jgi:hypothetical protein
MVLYGLLSGRSFYDEFRGFPRDKRKAEITKAVKEGRRPDPNLVPEQYISLEDAGSMVGLFSVGKCLIVQTTSSAFVCSPLQRP